MARMCIALLEIQINALQSVVLDSLAYKRHYQIAQSFLVCWKLNRLGTAGHFRAFFHHCSDFLCYVFAEFAHVAVSQFEVFIARLLQSHEGLYVAYIFLQSVQVTAIVPPLYSFEGWQHLSADIAQKLALLRVVVISHIKTVLLALYDPHVPQHHQ